MKMCCFKVYFACYIFVWICASFEVKSQKSTVVSMCNENDDFSKQYCKCNSNVVNCDFSQFRSPQREEILEMDGSNSIDYSVKRLCLCGTDKNVRVSLRSKFLPAYNRIHRVDLFNIKGILNVDEAFSEHFGGSLFMENVANYSRMRKFEFGRGFEFPLENTQGIGCCSKIATPSGGLPILYIKDTNVTYIEEQGINDFHLWKTVVINQVKVLGAANSAMLFSAPNLNVSILNSEFHKLSDMAIRLIDANNVALVSSKFHSSCKRLSFVSRSREMHTSLAIIGNVFSNAMILQMDAQNVVNWFNWYDIWDTTTFVNLDRTQQPDRVVSIEFNTVNNFIVDANYNLSNKAGYGVTFNENILSNCSCMLKTPTFLEKHTHRCRNPGKGGKMCAVDTAILRQACSNKGVQLNQLCNNKKVANVYVTESPLSWTKVQFKSKGISLKSSFISEQLKSIQLPIHNHELLKKRNDVSWINGPQTGVLQLFSTLLIYILEFNMF